jgi:hypothetical protein
VSAAMCCPDLLRANAEEAPRHQSGFVTADPLAAPDGTTPAGPASTYASSPGG